MAFTFTWEVTGLRTRDEINTDGEVLTDAVVQTYWKLTGKDENDNEGTFTGATPFTAKDVPEGEFVHFSELTEEVVLSWIKDVVENDKPYKQHIVSRIQNEIDQKKVKDAILPWAPEKNITPNLTAVPEINAADAASFKDPADTGEDVNLG